MQKNNTESWHFGLDYCSQTLNWVPTDTEECFNKSMTDPVRRSYLESMGWTDPEVISYQFNSHGFRCDEFDPGKSSIVTLGCSYTAGIGLPVDLIWPTLVGKSLGLTVYNISGGGYAADTCYRLGRYWIPKLQPKVVCILMPPRRRVELVIDPLYRKHKDPLVDTYGTYSTQLDTVNVKTDFFLKNWMTARENSDLNLEKNKLAIESIAKQTNAKFVCLVADELPSINNGKLVKFARDFVHPGPIGQQMLADEFLKILYEQAI